MTIHSTQMISALVVVIHCSNNWSLAVDTDGVDEFDEEDEAEFPACDTEFVGVEGVVLVVFIF